MWKYLWLTVFFALISKCSSCCTLGFEPINLNVVSGEGFTIDCIINCTMVNPRRSCRQYNASDMFFKYDLPELSSSEVSSSPKTEDCGFSDEKFSEEIDVGEDFSGCNGTSDVPSNCFENSSDDLSEYDGTSSSSVRIEQRYVKVVSRKRAQLTYPGFPKRFKEGFLDCCIDTKYDKTVNYCKTVHVLVGERPHMPIIKYVTVRNWDVFEFHWKTDKKNEVFNTLYRAWYKSSSSEDFLECPRAKEGCAQSCQVNVSGLGLNYNLSASRMIFKVNASNSLADATSPDAMVDLYDFVTPDPVHEVSVRALDSTVCTKFKSPKSGAEMIYEVRLNCSGHRHVTSLPKSSASIVEACVSDLLSYTNYSLSIRAKPASYGQWGSWSDLQNFTTPQKVPLAGPEVCRSCFELLSINEDETCNIRVFPKPLARAVARGRVMKYRTFLAMRNRQGTNANQTKFFNPENPGLDFIGLQPTSNYDVTVVAATEAGFNESIIASPLSINLMVAKELRSWPRNVTAFILDSTTVRVSWGSRRHDLSGFTVFWCRVAATFSQCKDPLQWSRVESNVTRFDITDLPAFDLLNYLFGVAVETADGYSSGVVWTKCLYNLSRVSRRPEVNSKVDRTKVQLNFSTDSECNAGFPYAYHITYCPQVDNDTKCSSESAVELTVDDDTCEVSHLAFNTNYLFIVSSLSVAGPSLSNAFLQLKTPGEGGGSTLIMVVIVVSAFIGCFIVIVIFLVTRYHERIRNWVCIRIEAPRAFQRVDRLQHRTLPDDSAHHPDYAHIKEYPPENLFHVFRGDSSAASNTRSTNLDSSSDHLILDITQDPSFRERCITTESNEGDNAASGDEKDNHARSYDDYARTTLCNKPDVVPLSPPLEPNFSFESNCISLDLGDACSDLPQPQLSTDAADDGTSLDLSSCNYAVGRTSDHQSGSSASTADDVLVKMPENGGDINEENSDHPLVLDSSGVERCNNALNVCSNDTHDCGSNDVVASGGHLNPCSSTVVAVCSLEDEGSDDDCSASSDDDYAVANLRNKELDPLLDTPAAVVMYRPCGNDSDSGSDSVGDGYAAVSLRKQTLDSTECQHQALNIPHLSFSASVHTHDPALSS